ncbi:MAG: hypothetical protein V4620_03715 [Bacteroidota bacterium]
MSKTIKYISFGKYETGGFKHELFFAQSLVNLLNEQGLNLVLQRIRKNKFYTNLFGYINLLLLGFTANASYNIVVARIAFTAVLRNLFNNNRTYIVLHNYDEQDGKSVWLKLYFKMLFALLRYVPLKRVSIITVAPYWVHYFETITRNNIKVHLFPNFFDNNYYTKFVTDNKKKQIHLGQWSFKNHPDVFTLAEQLHKEGYYCHMSTNYKNFAAKHTSFDVLYFEEFDNYLKHMAESQFTIAFTAINEGWNRVAHESILVHTPVIAYAKAGLKDLVDESHSYAVNNIAEAIAIIENKNEPVNSHLLAHYDISYCNNYLKPITAELLS